MKSEVVMVTGASAGIGRAIVREFASHGAHIGLIARGETGLNAAARDAGKLGGKALVLPADVSKNDQVEAAAEKLENAFGPIDVWVNDAMVSVFGPFMEITPEEYEQATRVTYLGFVNGTRAALKRMLPRDRGHIVQVGSALAYRGIPLQSAYCGAKHAIQGFMDSLRCELLHNKSNVTATMVQMPGVNTPQFYWVRNRLPNKPRPLGGVYQPEVAARAVYWAAHHDRREVYVGYPTVKAIIGNKLAASLGDHVLAREGYEGQQRPVPDSLDRPDNFWHPVEGDFGAHGPFDKEAKKSSTQLWLTEHRRWLGFAGLAAAGLAAGLILMRGRTRRRKSA